MSYAVCKRCGSIPNIEHPNGIEARKCCNKIWLDAEAWEMYAAVTDCEMCKYIVRLDYTSSIMCDYPMPQWLKETGLGRLFSSSSVTVCPTFEKKKDDNTE